MAQGLEFVPERVDCIRAGSLQWEWHLELFYRTVQPLATYLTGEQCGFTLFIAHKQWCTNAAGVDTDILPAFVINLHHHSQYAYGII